MLWLQSCIHLVNVLPAFSFPEALLLSVNDTDLFLKPHSERPLSSAKTSLSSPRTRSLTACSESPRECSKGIPKLTRIRGASCSPETSASPGWRQTLRCASSRGPAGSPTRPPLPADGPRAAQTGLPVATSLRYSSVFTHEPEWSFKKANLKSALLCPLPKPSIKSKLSGHSLASFLTTTPAPSSVSLSHRGDPASESNTQALHQDIQRALYSNLCLGSQWPLILQLFVLRP